MHIIHSQVPVRLHEKIIELRDPVVGLSHIEELIPENDPEVPILLSSSFLATIQWLASTGIAFRIKS